MPKIIKLFKLSNLVIKVLLKSRLSDLFKYFKGSKPIFLLFYFEIFFVFKLHNRKYFQQNKKKDNTLI